MSVADVHARWRKVRTHLPWGRICVSKSNWCRLSQRLALLGCIALSGCSGEENIQLKKLDPKVDSILGDLPKDYKETRPAFAQKRGSAKIGHDPSGVSQSK
jgi:hypothetical protein